MATWIRGGFTVGLLTLALTSCFDLEVAVTLRADGGGEQRFRLGVEERTLAVLQRASLALDADGTRSDPATAFDAVVVKQELEDSGFVVRECRGTRQRNRRVIEWTADFRTVATLGAGAGLGSGAGEWLVLKGRNRGGVRLVVYPRGYAAWAEAAKRAAEIDRVPDATRKEWFARQQARLAELDCVLRITVPGDIDYVSGNLVKTSNRAAEATVDAAEITTAADLVMALAPRYEIEFDGAKFTGRLDAEDPLDRARRDAAGETRDG